MNRRIALLIEDNWFPAAMLIVLLVLGLTDHLPVSCQVRVSNETHMSSVGNGGAP